MKRKAAAAERGAGLPRLLSVRAISDATTLPPSTIYDALYSGDLPAVRIGRAVRVDEREVLKWIDARRDR